MSTSSQESVNLTCEMFHLEMQHFSNKIYFMKNVKSRLSISISGIVPSSSHECSGSNLYNNFKLSSHYYIQNSCLIIFRADLEARKKCHNYYFIIHWL